MSALQEKLTELQRAAQPYVDQAEDRWEALPLERQRQVKIAALAFAVIFPIAVVVLPLTGGRVAAQRAVADAREQLETMRDLERIVLERGLSERNQEQKPRQTAKNTSLLATMDGIANKANVGALVQSMRPVNKSRDDNEREAVELQMDGLVLNEVVKLLYEVEYSDKDLVVQRLEIQKEPRNPNVLKVNLEVMQ